MGARDLSAITTPPPNRYPILTSVNTLTDEILEEAVNFELTGVSGFPGGTIR